MNIVVNARFLCQEITGVQRSAVEIARRVRTMDGAIRFVTHAGIKHDDLAEELGVEVLGNRTGHAWEQLELPRIARGATLVSLCNSGPVFMRNQLVTIHDAAPVDVPESYSFAFRTWFDLRTRLLAKRARTIVTDSRFSAERLAAFSGRPVESFDVVPLGHEHVFDIRPDASVIERHRLGHRPFVLTVGSRAPHKNFAALAAAIARLDLDEFDVVVAGGVSAAVHQHGNAGPQQGLKYIGYVSDAELRALYESAAAYVQPSYYEGFGLPPLEAMALGCPVISANAASLPEVGGNAVQYFDPRDPDDMASTIMRVMGDSELRDAMRDEGLEQARKFTWTQCAASIERLANTPLTTTDI